ncbi:MAG: protocatechuate 3,4-dioxygenase subunit beta, partial [Planktomarina sp.]
MTAFPPRDLDWQPAPLTPQYRSSLLRSPGHKRIQFP